MKPYFGLRSYTDNGEHYDGQIGSEGTPQEWLAVMVECVAEMARVLKPSGSIFLNVGDRYATTILAGNPLRMPNKATDPAHRGPLERIARGSTAGNIPNKSLLGLPWRLALACTDQLGLILRRDIIWEKANSLPESVGDRCRSSHEYLFHLVKQPRYYSAIDEIREPSDYLRPNNYARGTRGAPNGIKPRTFTDTANPLGRLPGSVWSIPSQPLIVPESLGVSHFAAFPMELPRRCILGWSPPGICAACGEGRRPVTTTAADPQAKPWRAQQAGTRQMGGIWSSTLGHAAAAHGRTIIGYTCACRGTTTPDVARRYSRPAVVLDPFGGTGTTALVASVLGRTGVSIDRSMDYTRLARWRTTDPAERARAMQVPKPPPVPAGQVSLFDLDAS